MRACLLLLLVPLWLSAPAAAQTAEQQEGQMRLYIQQLEDRVRQLTGENERLTYELNQARAALGQPQVQAGAPGQPGQTLDSGGAPQTLQPSMQADGNASGPGAPPRDLGQLAANPDDQLVPDGSENGAPVDLSTLAGGVAGELVQPTPGAPGQQGAAPGPEMAGMPAAPPPTTALSGSARDEYDLAYGYILTGDYALAEQTFTAWLASYPSDPQAPDAEFWLGESHLQQGEYRDAANAFLTVYKSAPDSPKGPDALLKLGVSLSALGEKTAACGTFAELGRRYPQASASLVSRVHDEENRAGCRG